MSDEYQETDTAKGELIYIPITIEKDRPIVLINYAAVMEVPVHPGIYESLQPKCGFYMARSVPKEDPDFNKSKGLLYHYAANKSTLTNWKTEENNIAWKDWSKVGVDLSEWIGKSNVFVVLESYDCVLSGRKSNKEVQICENHHKSHMYAHITCAPKELVLYKDCEGEEANVTITAPEGFSYRWYIEGDKGTTLSSERILKTKAADVDATYVCELTNHVGTFELKQFVDATDTINYEDVELENGEAFKWEKASGETIYKTGYYVYPEKYTGAELEHYSEACVKNIHRVHVNAKEIKCTGKFTIIDSICGDAQGINVRIEYQDTTVTNVEPNVTIHPSVKTLTAVFDEKWKKQEGETINIGGTTIVKKGYADSITFDVNGLATDSVYRIPMPLDSVVTETGEKFYVYPRPDDYTMTLYVRNTCGPDKAIINFTVRYPSWVIFQRWNDILSIHNETYNGGYEIANVEWFRNNEQKIEGRGEHKSYITTKDFSGEGTKLDTNDTFYAKLKRQGEDKSFCTCRFTPYYNDKEDKPIFADGINLAPSRNDSRRLRVITALSGGYTVYDLAGRAVQTGMFGDTYGAEEISIDPSVTRGTYLIFFRSDDGIQTTKKWIVE